MNSAKHTKETHVHIADVALTTSHAIKVNDIQQSSHTQHNFQAYPRTL